MNKQVYIAAAGFAVVAVTVITIAANDPSARADVPQIDPPVYRPVTSDLMNTVIQPRHIKLWLAAKAGNWTFAEYERHNIGGALARMTNAIPTYKGTSMENLVSSFAKPPLADLERAIKAKDEAAFTQAYSDLTTGCNSCHQATGHEMVVIKVPDTDPFPDQDFKPAAP